MFPFGLLIIAVHEEEKKANDPDYESPYDIDVSEIRFIDVVIGCAIGLSPFIMAFMAITIERWIYS